MWMVSEFLLDFGMASIIVAFSSSATYAIIEWFKKNKRKKRVT
jgi:hypothetical protein